MWFFFSSFLHRSVVSNVVSIDLSHHLDGADDDISAARLVSFMSFWNKQNTWIISVITKCNGLFQVTSGIQVSGCSFLWRWNTYCCFARIGRWEQKACPSSDSSSFHTELWEGVLLGTQHNVSVCVRHSGYLLWANLSDYIYWHTGIYLNLKILEVYFSVFLLATLNHKWKI